MLGLRNLIVHRDGDFLLEAEKLILQEKFKGAGCYLWITQPSDIEGYFCVPQHVASCVDIDMEEAISLLEEGVKSCYDPKVFRNKRSQVNKSEKYYPGGAGTPSIEAAERELSAHHAGKVKGKALLNWIGSEIHKRYKKPKSVLAQLQKEGNIAQDLRLLLEKE